VLAELRDRGIDSRIAIITAVDPDFDIIDMDFEDYIVKPVLKSELQDIVHRLIRLSTFDKRVQESFAIASKIEVLDTEKTHAELSANEDYESLRHRLNELQDSIQDLFAEFDYQDFTTVYSELKTAEQDDQ
jgi:YesN/AraC family two-component response regulator